MGNDKFMKDGAEGSKQHKSNAKAGAKAKPVSGKTETAAVEEIDAPEATISLFLSIGLIVGALIVGLIVGYMVAPKSASTGFGAPAGGSAPSLTPDQLNSRQLPPSHPSVPGMVSDGASGTTAPASETAPPADSGAAKDSPAAGSKKKSN